MYGNGQGRLVTACRTIILNPTSETPNRKLETLNPKPETQAMILGQVAAEDAAQRHHRAVIVDDRRPDVRTADEQEPQTD